jgi:3-deoxy-D-manno-octulosonic-acid transferase
MSFFKWYGGLQRKMLSRFDHLFVQNDSSKKLVDGIGLAKICSVSGDTRFDRVIEIAEKFEPIPFVEKFIGNSKTIVAGSTWKEDEEVLQKALAGIHDTSLKWIVAPHEINNDHLEDLQKLFHGAILFSELADATPKSETQNPKSETSNLKSQISNILIIDNIGMLSRLYKYSSLAYVGGGLKPSGVHNVLEAAVYNKPVIIGPYYEKYREAVGLVKSGGAIVTRNEDELVEIINRLIVNADDSYEKARHASKEYVWKNKGATEKILQFIQEKRLLTN